MIPMTVRCWGIYKGTKPNTTAFGRWYFGHYHVDREYDDGFCALYDCVVPIE